MYKRFWVNDVALLDASENVFLVNEIRCKKRRKKTKRKIRINPTK